MAPEWRHRNALRVSRPPSHLPGGMGVGESVKMSGEISIAGKENEEGREGGGRVDFEFIVFASLSSAAPTSTYETMTK